MLLAGRWADSLAWAGERVNRSPPSFDLDPVLSHRARAQGGGNSLSPLLPVLSSNPSMMQASLRLGSELSCVSLAIEHYVCSVAGVAVGDNGLNIFSGGVSLHVFS